jgi:hypothetical protein
MKRTNVVKLVVDEETREKLKELGVIHGKVLERGELAENAAVQERRKGGLCRDGKGGILGIQKLC